jgi:hypothetical protein
MFTKEDLIYSYTRKDAITDRLQFNIDSIDKSLRKDAGIKVPLFITDSVMNIINESVSSGCSEEKEVLRNILDVFTQKVKTCSCDTLNFIVFINKKFRNSVRRLTFELIAQIGPMDIDNQNPAVTIMTERDI